MAHLLYEGDDVDNCDLSHPCTRQGSYISFQPYTGVNCIGLHTEAALITSSGMSFVVLSIVS